MAIQIQESHKPVISYDHTFENVSHFGKAGAQA